jgi:ABC-type dipeptide transport system, periplasmic component
MRRRLKVGVSRSIIILIIIILIVVGGIGFYLYNNRGVQSPTQTPTVVVPSTITVDRAAPPVSVDPATSFDVVGGEIMRNVYQTLVFYNGSSTSTFVGVLASNWTVTNNGTTYIFHLWTFHNF